MRKRRLMNNEVVLEKVVSVLKQISEKPLIKHKGVPQSSGVEAKKNKCAATH